ncbi:MAG: hypothetical protein A2511_06275 [Deltaproteobacteria bacterium RIFOXYD12_FULL_50_9]|nr:MAG: hypothetical protein A2511_06275 [Deltaproteobacteria bacterium RIFOXYD12_FULL_50_9]
MKPCSRLSEYCFLGFVIVALGVLTATLSHAKEVGENTGAGALVRPPISVIQGYSSVPQMINQVCEEASTQFYDFFGSGEVKVKPFAVIEEFNPRRNTVLGVTLADQMAARINSDANEVSSSKGKVVQTDQGLDGVIQELDGFLRVHMSGVNFKGERRSYVVNVEMSEAVYRALHALVVISE